MRKALHICFYVNAVLALALSGYLFLLPAALLAWDLRDPGLRGGQIPRCAFRWHKSLSPKYEKWARLPAAVYVGLVLPLALGVYEVVASGRKLRRLRRADPRRYVPAPQVQTAVWLVLLVATAAAWWFAVGWLALVFLLAALILPWRRRTLAEGSAYKTQEHTQSES